MTLIRLFFSLIVLTVGILSQALYAQQPAGDTIFVTVRSVTTVKFPYRLDAVYTEPVSTQYTIAATGKLLKLKSISENSEPAHLFVTTGENIAEFVLMYKQRSSDDGWDLDYSDKNRFDELIGEQNNRRNLEKLQQNFEKETTAKIESSPVPKELTVSEPQLKTDTSHAPELEQIQKDVIAFIDSAKLNRDKAVEVKPEFPPENQMKKTTVVMSDSGKLNQEKPKDTNTGLEPVAGKKEEVAASLKKDSLEDIDRNKEYYILTGAAKALFDVNKYNEAKEKYKEALTLKAGDLYAATQIEKIDKILKDSASKTSVKTGKRQYKDYIAEGDKAMVSGDLSDAKNAFEQALLMQPNDPVASSKLKLIADWKKREALALEIEKKYSDAKDSADMLYNAGDYENAGVAYNKALSIINRPWPKEQLKKIAGIMNERVAKENEKKYIEVKDSADQLFNSGDYENAKAAYNKALRIVDRPWPREQLKKIAGIMNERVAKENEEKYNHVKDSADQLFNSGDYENAKAVYNKVLRIADRPWPREQLQKIARIMNERAAKEIESRNEVARKAEKERQEKALQEKENNYTVLINLADMLFKEGNYKNAKREYIKARALFARPWPLEQIEAIDKGIRQQAASENEENQKQLKQEKNAARYTLLINKADAAFEKNDYAGAKQLYLAAIQIKDSGDHPQQRLKKIEAALEILQKEKNISSDSIQKTAEVKKRYNAALVKGRVYAAKNNLADAKIAYEEAASIMPSQNEAKIQLGKVNARLEEREQQSRYDAAVQEANRFLRSKEYDSALTYYKAAFTLKPSETYLATQIGHCEFQLRAIAQQKAYNDSLENLKVIKAKLNTALEVGDKANKEKRFSDAAAAFNDALAIDPGNSNAQRGLRIATDQLKMQMQKNAQQQNEKPADSLKRQ